MPRRCDGHHTDADLSCATIVVTRNGRPVFDLVPHRKLGGLNRAAGTAYLRAKGIRNPVPFIADDFDDPLPEEFLLAALPSS